MGSIYEDFKEYCGKEGINFDSYAEREKIEQDGEFNGDTKILKNKYLIFSEDSKPEFEKFKDFWNQTSTKFIKYNLIREGASGFLRNSLADFQSIFDCINRDFSSRCWLAYDEDVG